MVSIKSFKRKNCRRIHLRLKSLVALSLCTAILILCVLFTILTEKRKKKVIHIPATQFIHKPLTFNNFTVVRPYWTDTNSQVLDENLASILPRWMYEYFDWHSQQLQQINAQNYDEFRFLFVRCLQSDRSCGGLSDRLKSLPTMLLVAARSKRLLFIYWNHPVAVEEFLIPAGYLNWTLPEYLEGKLTGRGTPLYQTIRSLSRGANSSTSIISARLQDQHGGSEYYNSIEGQRMFREVFRATFHALFQPSPPLLKALQEARRVAGLSIEPDAEKAGNRGYVAAHLRANYDSNRIPDKYIGPYAINAVECASRLAPDEKVWFTSDSQLALREVEIYAMNNVRSNQKRAIRIATLSRAKQPLHLDKATSRVASEYYDIFVDLYLFAGASCVAHGVGGFGRLGVLLSRNASCFFKYFAEGLFLPCDGGVVA